MRDRIKRHHAHHEVFFYTLNLTNSEVAALTGLTKEQVCHARIRREIRNYKKEPRFFRPKKEAGNNRYTRWNPSTVFCKTSNAACHLCPNHKHYGLHRNKGCKMPDAVKALETAGVEIPKWVQDEAAEHVKTALAPTR